MGLAAGGAAQSLLKEGHKHMSGLEQAILKNTGACKQFADILKTSLGPNGQNKMVLNHLDKLFVTSDAATIVGELEVQHPAAKMVVMASKQVSEGGSERETRARRQGEGEGGREGGREGGGQGEARRAAGSRAAERSRKKGSRECARVG